MASPPSRDSRGMSGIVGERTQTHPGRVWAEIDLGAVQENVRALRAALLAPARLLAVVKADAYGHGAVEVARAAVEAGASGLGVATTEEGVQLRRAGIRAPVLLLGYTPPGDAETAVAHDLAVTVFQPDAARAVSRAAGHLGRAARVHIKIDTGMGRVGVAPADAVGLAREIQALEGVTLEGCFTHFATADDPDVAPARAQLAAFLAALGDLEAAGVRPGLRHAANSAALLALPESHLDLVRCGIALYGVAPAPHLAGRVPLVRVMRVRARIGHVKRVDRGTPISYGHTYRASRPTTIATIPVGYADGYFRLLSGRGEVLLHGRRVPVVGRVTMDQMMVDAGDLPVAAGDEAELWGEDLPVEDVAERAQTISYEVLARLGRRVPRVFVRGGQVVGIRSLLD